MSCPPAPSVPPALPFQILPFQLNPDPTTLSFFPCFSTESPVPPAPTLFPNFFLLGTNSCIGHHRLSYMALWFFLTLVLSSQFCLMLFEGRAYIYVFSHQFGSVSQLCLTLCNPVDSSTPGFPVHHQLPELSQTHVHQVGDAIQPSHPLSPPSPSWLQSFPASGSFPMSQFFTSGGQSIGAEAEVLPMNIQDWFPLRLTGWISLQSKGLSRVFCNTTVQKHQFFGAQLSL